VVEAGDEKHQFGGLVACVVGAMAEVHPRAPQRPRAAVDGGAHGVTGGFACGANGVSGCVG
jgi:hypothetical protein